MFDNVGIVAMLRLCDRPNAPRGGPPALETVV
jgi:hypothetical protein